MAKSSEITVHLRDLPAESYAELNGERIEGVAVRYAVGQSKEPESGGTYAVTLRVNDARVLDERTRKTGGV